MLQEFDLEIRDKRGIENVVADHLSRIPNAPTIQAPINEDFPDEHILTILKELWYADIVNIHIWKVKMSVIKFDTEKFDGVINCSR